MGNERKHAFLLLTGLLLVVCIGLYITPYLILSREGYAESDQYNMKGFYYFTPQNSNSWRWRNQACICLFYPLNKVDCWLGVGKEPAYEPLWGLARD